MSYHTSPTGMDGSDSGMRFVVKEQWHTVCRRHADTHAGHLSHHAVYAFKPRHLIGFRLAQKRGVNEANGRGVCLSRQNEMLVCYAK